MRHIVPVIHVVYMSSWMYSCMALVAQLEGGAVLHCQADTTQLLCRYVMDVYMPRDRMNRAEHRGFGFVTFETEAAIIRVASYGGHMIR